jgi:hypothetical protein
MTVLVLGAILCVLIIIARELRLLRKQRDTLLSATGRQQETSAGYKPPRSGRKLSLVDVDEWLAAIIAVVIWWRFVLPLLPAHSWIKYPISVIGILALGFLGSIVVPLLDPLHRWTER